MADRKTTQATTRMHERVVLVQRHVSGWSGRRFDREESRELTRRKNAEEDAARVNKLIVPKWLLQPIEQLDGAWQRFHDDLTLPYPAKGMAILPTANITKYMDGTSTFRDRRIQLVRDLESKLPAALADAPRRLGGLAKADDIPKAADIVKRFTADVALLPFPQASELGELVDDEVKARTDQFLASTVGDAVRDTWQRVYDIVARVVERLRAKADDPKRKLYASVIDDVRDIVEALPALNITGDGRLDALARELSSKLAVHDIDSLRDDDQLCRDTADEAERILARMKGYVS